MPILPTDDLITKFNSGNFRWIIANLDIAEEEIRASVTGAATGSEEDDFNAMKEAAAAHEPCYVLFLRPDVHSVSLITVLSDAAHIKMKMLMSSSTFGLRRSLGRNIFDKGMNVQTAEELDYAAYVARRDAHEERDETLLTEAEKISNEAAVALAHEATECAGAAELSGGAVASAHLGLAWEPALEAAIRERDDEHAVVFTVRDERLVLAATTSNAPAEIADAAEQAGAAFIVAPGAPGKTIFAYYVTHGVPLKTRMVMSGAKQGVVSKLRDEYSLTLTSWEASDRETLTERLGQRKELPRATMEEGNKRARPRPVGMRRRTTIQ